MKYKIQICLLFFSIPIFAIENDFYKSQLKYSRFRTAINETSDTIDALLNENTIELEKLEIFIRVFKKEKVLELWGKNKSDNEFSLLKVFDICKSSGKLGPKRIEGDLQVPEGYYHISHFNPSSRYYLSLGINYPNKSDKILGEKYNLGGNIYIHGDCVTIGCIPITDDCIKELYVLAVYARAYNQDKIPVHIFPQKLDKDAFKNLQDHYKNDTELLRFWTNLQPGYLHFEKYFALPEINISNSGNYIYQDR